MLIATGNTVKIYRFPLVIIVDDSLRIIIVISVTLVSYYYHYILNHCICRVNANYDPHHMNKFFSAFAYSIILKIIRKILKGMHGNHLNRASKMFRNQRACGKVWALSLYNSSNLKSTLLFCGCWTSYVTKIEIRIHLRKRGM